MAEGEVRLILGGAVPDETEEVESSQRLTDLLNEVSNSSDLKQLLDVKLVFEHIADTLRGAAVVDYLIGYKPASFVSESEDELGIAVLTKRHIFEFVYGPHRKRYDMTPLASLAWIKVDEKETTTLEGGVEHLTRFEAAFGSGMLNLEIQAAGSKAAKLNLFARHFHERLARYGPLPVAYVKG